MWIRQTTAAHPDALTPSIGPFLMRAVLRSLGWVSRHFRRLRRFLTGDSETAHTELLGWKAPDRPFWLMARTSGSPPRIGRNFGVAAADFRDFMAAQCCLGGSRAVVHTTLKHALYLPSYT